MTERLNRYVDYFLKDDLVGLEKYRASIIPDKLYKYYPLFDTNEESDKRLDAFKNNQIWFSSIESLNDPCEFEGYFIDENKMKKEGFNNINLVNKRLQDEKKFFTVSCFSGKVDNFLMWSHYANGHRGYCVEYQVSNKNEFYKMEYSPERIDATAAAVKYTYQIPGSPEGNKTRALMKLIFAHKSIEWSYEEEYRLHKTIDLILPAKDKEFLELKEKIENGIKKEEKRKVLTDFLKHDYQGGLYSNNSLGIEPIALYIGINCSDRNFMELEKIWKWLNVNNIYKMGLPIGKSYKLNYYSI
jgi:hypothetical protein